jgi:hypothetical protein
LAGGAGAAGGGGEVTTIPPQFPTVPNSYWVTIISLVTAAFTGLSNVFAPLLTERAKTKTAQIQNDMQMREIEKLRLELALEEKESKTAKKKVRSGK